MTYYDERLKELGQQRARLRQLDAEMKSLFEQKRELERKTADLDWQSEREQQDVTRLEGRSLARFFYHLTGRLEEKLTQERAEALAAAVKHDAAQKELAAVEEQLTRLGAQAGALRGCEARYQALLEEKAAALRRAGTPEGERVLALERRVSDLTLAGREIDEAIATGLLARNTADQVIERFGDAEGFGVWDMLGGDLIADLAKHSALDDAQELIEQLQIELGRFRTELADVQIGVSFQAHIGGFLHFADYFFDGLFADWAVMDKIGQAKQRAEETRKQIAGVIARLEDMREAGKRDILEAQQALDQLVRDARL